MSDILDGINLTLDGLTNGDGSAGISSFARAEIINFLSSPASLEGIPNALNLPQYRHRVQALAKP